MGDKKRVDGEVVATSVDGDAEVVTKVVSGPKSWVEAVETQGAQGQSAAEICVGMQEKADERGDPFKATELNEHEKMSPIHAFLFAEDRARAAGGLLYRRWQLGKIMETQRAKCFFIFLVLVNAVLIGVRLDYGGDDSTWNALEHAFLTVFCIEVGLRLVAFGLLFFTDGWNWIDFVVVMVGVVDWFILAFGGGSDNSAFTAIRLIRIFRVIRLFGFFDRLSRLVQAFIGALKDVVWVAMLVVIVLYIFAILACNFYGHDQELQDAGFDSELYFGTIPASMATLFQIMTLDSWMSGITRPIGEVKPMAYFVLILWCCIGALGLLNLMTAIFIDSLTTLSRKEMGREASRLQKRRSKALNIIREMFVEHDANNDCTLDQQEMEQVVDSMRHHPEILSNGGISSDQIKQAMCIADTDGDGVDYGEFIAALDVMDTPVTRKDTMQITKKITQVEGQIATLEGEVRGLKEQVQSLVNVLTQQR